MICCYPLSLFNDATALGLPYPLCRWWPIREQCLCHSFN